MSRWNSAVLVTGVSCLAFAMALGVSSSAPGRSLEDVEMSSTIGGLPPNGDKCTNECNGNLNIPCSGTACAGGGNISPGDRCQGGTGGSGSVYNCINAGTPMTTQCTLGGSDATCSPDKICRWGNIVEIPTCPRVPHPIPGGGVAGKWGATCVEVDNGGNPVSGKSSCTNI